MVLMLTTPPEDSSEGWYRSPNDADPTITLTIPKEVRVSRTVINTHEGGEFLFRLFMCEEIPPILLTNPKSVSIDCEVPIEWEGLRVLRCREVSLLSEVAVHCGFSFVGINK